MFEYVFVYVYLYVYICGCPRKPSKDIRSLGAGFSDSCESLDVGAGN